MEAQIPRLIVKHYMNFRKISKTNNRNEEFLKKKKDTITKKHKIYMVSAIAYAHK